MDPEEYFFVKKQSLFRIPGAVYAVGVFKVPDIQTVDDHGIYVADFIKPPEREEQQKVLPLHGGKEEAHRLFRHRCVW